MRPTGIFLALALLVAPLAGCSDWQPYVSGVRLRRGLVLVLPGIEGRGPINEAICEGLDRGGVDWAIEMYDWTVSLAYLTNQRDESRNRLKALEIVSRIVRYRMAYPGRPVVLVGQSAGGAIATWVLEALPPSQQATGAILLAASLSPGYMLDRALAHSRRGVINFYSSRDWILLGVGTMISGTMDGRHSESAGRAGFKVPKTGARGRLYEKLFQVAWTPEMARAGHTGTHVTTGSMRFVAAYVAPFVRARQWNADRVAQVLAKGRPSTRPAGSTGLGRSSATTR